jgi:hypothetical protein
MHASILFSSSVRFCYNSYYQLTFLTLLFVINSIGSVNFVSILCPLKTLSMLLLTHLFTSWLICFLSSSFHLELPILNAIRLTFTGFKTWLSLNWLLMSILGIRCSIYIYIYSYFQRCKILWTSFSCELSPPPYSK